MTTEIVRLLRRSVEPLGQGDASADEGETFTEVASHLPDVLCVRAAVVVGNPAGAEIPLAAAEATLVAETEQFVEAAAQTRDPGTENQAPVPG